MLIQINTDRNIAGGDALARRVESAIKKNLDRFSDHITRVEAHLGDENSQKGGSADKRCVLEARAAGIKPVAVRHHAPTVAQAVNGALEQLKRALDSTLGRLKDR
ncbi:MAG: HPF/RaiA family ribosome-associated protein [Xanthomonadales bacterium]|nr:HPF/RaiA family ribosome-associated protein [Xanthomonadales bacterium]